MLGQKGSGSDPSAEIVTKTDSYTLTAAENGKIIEMNKGTAVTLTLPETSTEALPAGFQCAVVQIGAGQITVAKEGSDTIKSKDSNLALTGQYSVATIYKRTAGSPNDWFLGGDLA